MVAIKRPPPYQALGKPQGIGRMYNGPCLRVWHK
jgi:hypothetical protein